jgi:uncharacterized membrane protein
VYQQRHDPTTPTATRPQPDALMAHVVYGLYAASFFNGVTALIGVVIAYVKRGDVAGHWLESHYRWQIATFWWGLLLSVVGGVLTLVLIGWLILSLAAVWFIYRIVKGWLRLGERRAIENPNGFL